MTNFLVIDAVPVRRLLDLRLVMLAIKYGFHRIAGKLEPIMTKRSLLAARTMMLTAASVTRAPYQSAGNSCRHLTGYPDLFRWYGGCRQSDALPAARTCPFRAD